MTRPQGEMNGAKKKGGDLSGSPPFRLGLRSDDSGKKSRAVIYYNRMSRQKRMFVRFATDGGFIGARMVLAFWPPPPLTVT